jgi:TPR repeat protein
LDNVEPTTVLQQQAKNGDVDAQRDGRPKNMAEAVKWYRKAARKGHVEAMYNLAKCYEKGDGVRQNFRYASKWLCTAALREYVPAISDVG